MVFNFAADKPRSEHFQSGFHPFVRVRVCRLYQEMGESSSHSYTNTYTRLYNCINCRCYWLYPYKFQYSVISMVCWCKSQTNIERKYRKINRRIRAMDFGGLWIGNICVSQLVEKSIYCSWNTPCVYWHIKGFLYRKKL